MSPHADALGAWTPYVSGAALSATLGYLIQPEEYTARITERVQLRDETVVRHVIREIYAPHIKHLIAIATPLRGELIDMLRIEAADGVLAITPNRTTTNAIAGAILEQAAKAAGVQPESPYVRAATLAVVRPIPESKALYNALRTVRRWDDTHYQTMKGPVDPDLLNLARNRSFMRIFRFLRIHRLLLVPVHGGHDGPLKVAYSYELGSSAYRRRSRHETVRRLFGLSPYDFEFETPLALQVPSYHLRLRAPMNHYVRRLQPLVTSMPVSSTAGPVRPSRVSDWGWKVYHPAEGRAFVQYSRRDADGLAHFYSGDLQQASVPRRMILRITLAEVPLGQLGAASLRVIVVAALTIFLWVNGPRFVTSASSVGVSLLLALPALLGVGSLWSLPLGNIKAPLVARVSSLLSGLAALTASTVLLEWQSRYSGCANDRSTTSCSGHTDAGEFRALSGICTALSLVLVVSLSMGVVNLIEFFLARRAKANPYSRASDEEIGGRRAAGQQPRTAIAIATVGREVDNGD